MSQSNIAPVPASTSTSKPKIVVVGTGWGGFTFAHSVNLAKYDVVVISPIRTVQYTPLLASAAAGMFNFRLAEEPLRRRSKAAGLQYYKAVATDIDFEKRSVQCKSAVEDLADQGSETSRSFSVSYDKLVLAPGCDVQTFGTPGAQDHALFLRTTNDARKIQQRLLEMLDAASLPGLSDAQQREILQIRIVGGGAIGIEATAELWDAWEEDLKFVYPHLQGKMTICIHDVAPAILTTFDKRLGDYALQKLKGRGVMVKTSSHIEKVEEQSLWTKEDGKLNFGLLIWATGNGINPLVKKLRVKKIGKLQRIATDRQLRVLREDDRVMEGVYAMGDAADIDGHTLPTLAEVAVQKGEYLARELNHKNEPTADFEYRQTANLAYIGEHDGVVGGTKEWMTGHRAWIAWRSGSILHWPRSWRRTLMIGISWMFNWVGGRDIARKW